MLPTLPHRLVSVLLLTCIFSLSYCTLSWFRYISQCKLKLDSCPFLLAEVLWRDSTFKSNCTCLDVTVGNSDLSQLFLHCYWLQPTIFYPWTENRVRSAYLHHFYAGFFSWAIIMVSMRSCLSIPLKYSFIKILCVTLKKSLFPFWLVILFWLARVWYRNFSKFWIATFLNLIIG